MLQLDEPEDFVVASGEQHSVRTFAELAFAHVGLNWEEFVEVDASLLRPAEVNSLRGDATKAREKLEWRSNVTFRELVAMMVEADLERVAWEIRRHEALPQG